MWALCECFHQPDDLDSPAELVKLLIERGAAVQGKCNVRLQLQSHVRCSHVPAADIAVTTAVTDEAR